MHPNPHSAPAAGYFSKIPFPEASLWCLPPLRPISQRGKLSFLDLRHFSQFHWFSAKNQVRTRKQAHQAHESHVLIKKGPIYKISKLAASFEALSHLRAIKTGDSWAWCTKFGAKTWFFAEMQGNCKNWRKSKNPNSTHAKFGSMVQNIIGLAQEKEFLKNILSTTHNCEKGAPLKKPRFPWFL